MMKNPQPGVIALFCQAVGLTVISMRRIRIGGVSMGQAARRAMALHDSQRKVLNTAKAPHFDTAARLRCSLLNIRIAHMIHNDVLRSVRYMLDISDNKVVDIIKLGGLDVTKEDVLTYLKKDEEEGFVRCPTTSWRIFWMAW